MVNFMPRAVINHKSLVCNRRFAMSPSAVYIELQAEPISDDDDISPTVTAVAKCRQIRSMSDSEKGSDWTDEITSLVQARTTYEAAVSLKRIENLLDIIDPQDRIKFCKIDFMSAISQMKQEGFLISEELKLIIRAVQKNYFEERCLFDTAPLDILIEIFAWIPIDDFSPIPAVCSEWNILGTSDQVWRTFYTYKFLRHNPATMPVQTENYLKSFRSRLASPQLGDKVEVAWRGKFRLEALDVYQGLAWWVAEVVDIHSSVGKYKIRYPGWEFISSGYMTECIAELTPAAISQYHTHCLSIHCIRWDEWVPRSRLRWAVESNEVVQIRANDVVELWCCGANVPGAWLESKVLKARDGRYCVGQVLSTGSLWVDRYRLRLVKHVIPLKPDSSTGLVVRNGEGQSRSHLVTVVSNSGQSPTRRRRGYFSRFRLDRATRCGIM